MDRFQLEFPPMAPRLASCAVFGDEAEEAVDDYIAAGRLPDCTELAAISRLNPRMPIPELLAAFDDHRSACAMCAAIAAEDAIFYAQPAEPECSCQLDAGDLFDPRGCDVHNANSPWNVRMRAVSSMDRYEGMVA